MGSGKVIAQVSRVGCGAAMWEGVGNVGRVGKWGSGMLGVVEMWWGKEQWGRQNVCF